MSEEREGEGHHKPEHPHPRRCWGWSSEGSTACTVKLWAVSGQMGKSSSLDREKERAPTWNLERGQRKNRGCKEGESSGVGESFRPHCSKCGPQEAVSLHHQGSSEEEQPLAPAGCCPSEGQISHFHQAPRQCACMVKSEMLWPDRSVSRRRVCVSNSLRGSRDRGLLKGRLKNSHSTHQ